MLNDHSHKWWVFVGIVLLSFTCYLDYTVVNVALPTIQKQLQADLTLLQWVMNSYFLALCILATIMGRCGDLYGRRRIFYIGVNIFAIASLIAGLSTTIHWLIFGRFLQGVGAAIVLPLGPSLLPEAFPEKERGKIIAWFGSLGGIALALGPVLGGAIVTYCGWRCIFFVNIPIILFGYLFALNSVKESTNKHINRELDWAGMLFLAFAMGGIVMGLINGQVHGWLNILTMIYLVVGLISSVILFNVERNKENPLIDFGDFSNLMFYSGATLCFLAGALSAAALFFDPLYLQVVRGQSPEFSGFVLFAIPIAVFIVAFLVGWMIEQLGIINTIISGLTLAIVACLLQIFFTTVTPLWYILITFVSLGGMWAMGNTVPIIAAQTAVGSNRSSVATGTMVTMFNIGGSIGLAISVVAYHFAGMKSLSLNTQQVSVDQYAYIVKLLENPTQAQKLQENTVIHSLFQDAFMQGFYGVMWFLFGVSTLLLLSVLLFKVLKKT